jgi:nucleoside-diphosphate-sugar epimerase
MDIHDMSFFDANTRGVANLIQASKELPNLKRVLFVSSLLVCPNGHVPSSDTEYDPPNLYGESKVIGEKLVRDSKMPCSWVIVRPTSIWGPWFEHSYRTFFKVVDRGLFVHPGAKKIVKPLSFVGNTVHMMMKILLDDNPNIDRNTYYLADYPWYSTRNWANTVQNILNSKKIKTAPLWFLKVIAIAGDLIKKIFKLDPPLTSVRIKNMLTGGAYPIDNTKRVVGELPYDLNESVYLTAQWMYENNLIKHKPEVINSEQ